MFVFVYIYIYIHTHTYAYIYMYMCIYIYTHIFAVCSSWRSPRDHGIVQANYGLVKTHIELVNINS